MRQRNAGTSDSALDIGRTVTRMFCARSTARTFRISTCEKAKGAAQHATPFKSVLADFVCALGAFTRSAMVPRWILRNNFALLGCFGNVRLEPCSEYTLACEPCKVGANHRSRSARESLGNLDL